MNRRIFIKSCSIAASSIPFISFGKSTEKRNPLSLFTIEELREFCKMNNLHYVEDNEIWLSKYNQKMITHGGKNFWIYNRWPFIHTNRSNDWYELLKWEGLTWQTEYKHFFLYDIVETTLPYQKKAGETYSVTCCSKLSYEPYSHNTFAANIQRIIKAKTYCIKDQCWYKPVINDTSPYWYVDGLERV